MYINEANNKPLEAIDLINQALIVEPKNYFLWFQKARIEYELEGFSGALENFTKAININHNYYQAWFGRGRGRLKSNDFNGSIEDFTSVIKINPEHVGAWVYRGSAKYRKIGDHDMGDKGAIGDFTKAIEIDPNQINAWLYRGFNRALLGDFTGAISDLNAGKKIDLWNPLILDFDLFIGQLEHDEVSIGEVDE